MLRPRSALVMVLCGLLVAMLRFLVQEKALEAQDEARLLLQTQRGAASDLEIRGLKGETTFVSYQALTALPQVGAMVKRDENFTEIPKDGAMVRGVEFGVLMRALGTEASAVEAVCSDGYTATYPAEYTRQHHPILGLTIGGVAPQTWAQKTHTGDLGPYFVAYSNFVPSFHVLAHDDRPQVPVQLVRLEFAPPERMFAGIDPSKAAGLAAGLAADAPVKQGYRIAQQNCFRCHDAGGFGGTKAGRGWKTLAKDARTRPEWFQKWVHDPQSVDAKAEMPANPKYDRATLTALTKYFETFSANGD